MKAILTLLVAALVCALVAAPGAHAAEPDLTELIDGLAAKSFKQKTAAVERLAATGDPRAVPALTAMLEGRLYTLRTDGRVVVAEKSGGVFVLAAPLTGESLGQAVKKEIKKVRVNNRLRGLLRGVLGGLTLLSPDMDTRRAAVDSVLKARDESMLPVLEKAISAERDADLRGRMEMARAAIRLFSRQDPDARRTDLEILSGHPVPEVRSLLAEFLAGPARDDPALVEAGEEALDRVERSLEMWEMVGHLYRGLSLGSVLLLAAVGLAITFGVMGVINMAHGEMVMLGAYTTFMVQEVFRSSFPGAFDYSILVAVPLAFLVAGAVGVAIERGVIRFLYGRPLETLLATWGISLILQQTVRAIFGPTNREVGAPSWMSGAIETSTGLVLTYNRLWIILFSLAVVGLIALVIKKTAFGLQMRSVTQNRTMAASMGIRAGWVDAMTFGLGSGVAGMAGVALSQIDNVSPNLGQSYIIDSFMVVVFGGVGNLWGTVVGAFSLGIANKFLEPLSGAVLGKILVLVAIILFIQKRPRGLFALKGRAVET